MSGRNMATVKMECIECCKLFPMTELRLLFPRREFGLPVFTHEPDFFCEACVRDLGMASLKQFNKAEWLKSGSCN